MPTNSSFWLRFSGQGFRQHVIFLAAGTNFDSGTLFEKIKRRAFRVFRIRQPGQMHLRQVTVRPFMIHQYAQRIAESWTTATGRRPAVHVESYVMLNYKVPQSLIDPQIDLASTPFKLFSHNEWILPLKSRERLTVAGPPRPATSPF